jgi:histidinol phosphatase-like enzyme
MIEKLIKNWPIIKKKSFMIGDQISDKIAAETSNLYFEYPKKKFYNQINKICKKLLIN